MPHMDGWFSPIGDIARMSGGVVSRHQLLRAGIPSADVERLRAAGRLTVIRRGWYRLERPRPIVAAAVEAGAVVTCVSALGFHNPEIWVPPGITKTHLRWPAHVRTRRRTHEQCRAFRTLETPRAAVDPLDSALLCAANCLDPDQLAAVLDSTLRMTVPLTQEYLQQVFAGAPPRIIRVLRHLDPLAGSGTESMVRYRLQCRHIAVRSQVTIPGVGTVDLLVGDKLIIECDSEGHHGGVQRKTDLKRDRISVRGDYRVMRIDYEEVVSREGWAAAYRDIEDLVRTGRHRGKVRTAPVATMACDSTAKSVRRPNPAS